MGDDYDYRQLAQGRLYTKVQNFDQITSVTQNAVNRKLADIYNVEPTLKSFKITKQTSSGEVTKMEASLNASSVQFQLNSKKYSVVFFLAFKTGWFKWYDEFDDENKTQSVDNWICAFNVDLTFQQLDNLDPNSKIAKTIRKYGLGEPGNYHVMQLLIDFSTADVINYRKDLSSMPGLSGGGMSPGQIADITAAFGKMIDEYLQTIRLSDDGNPHTIINIPKWKNPEQLPAPSIQMTDLKFQCYPFIPFPKTEGVEGDGQNMLCYIEMTEHRPMPHDELNFSDNWVIPMETSKPDGTVALSRRAFIDGWFLKKMGDKINKATDIMVKEAEIYQGGMKWDWGHDHDQNLDYNFVYKPENGVPTWVFERNTRMKPTPAYGNELDVTASVYNLVQFAPGVRDGVAKLIVSGTTSAYARGSLYNGAQGATLTGSFRWAATFSLFTENNKLNITMYLDLDGEPEGLKVPFPGGDGDIVYDPEPVAYVKQSMPKEPFEEMLKELRALLLDDWIFIFAGSDVFDFKRAMFNYNADLLLDLYYQETKPTATASEHKHDHEHEHDHKHKGIGCM